MTNFARAHTTPRPSVSSPNSLFKPLFHTADNQPADADPTVTVAPASLEGSNVNAVSAMVDMITNARQFQMQTKLLDSANSNDQSANKLLDFS